MRYRSKPVEVEAIQWTTGDGDHTRHRAEWIVNWVNANGGEARYVPERRGLAGDLRDVLCIAVRTVNGWAYAKPGDYVVMGDATIRVQEVPEAGPGEWRDPKIRDFYPCDPETFERRWVSAAEEA